ncbi:MAG TPA: phosphomannomutase/phosphoglucomutase [Dongiaceae bacterium]|nr:phosphomannomutase/phosphoglucomutase [Dongiaceae bacterium]
MQQPHCFHSSILRECDIRGIFGETLSPADATALGGALVALTRRMRLTTRPRIAVARDGRLSSPILERYLLAAIDAAGGEPVSLGCGPSPMLYFAAHHLPVDAAIMVTGSHNPKSHNGFKMMIGHDMVHGTMIDQLAALAMMPATIPATIRALAAGGNMGDALPTHHRYPADDISNAYIDRVIAGLGGGDTGGLSIGWDAGNGATGDILRRLTQRLPGRHVLLNAEIDGRFPAHHPDPLEPANLRQLQQAVRDQKLDLGIAFDGDGDRIGAVDGLSRIVWGDQLLAILSRDVLRAHPGTTIIADVKASQTLFDEIARLGGSPLMWKTGHALIKIKMIEMQAKLAGEMSGHIFFADDYYGYDDALYAAMRLLRVMTREDLSLAQLADQLAPAVNTPEIRLDCSEDRKFAVVARVADLLKRQGADVDMTDGVRVRRPRGWWLLRASNTQAALVVRAEARTKPALLALLDELRAYLADEALSLDGIAA